MLQVASGVRAGRENEMCRDGSGVSVGSEVAERKHLKNRGDTFATTRLRKGGISV